MRSAPTMTHCTAPVFIRCEAAESAISVAGIPSCSSSQAVRRAPCCHGRVSPAYTLPMRPCATPARITPSAVPKPAVASEPVLQWVSTPLPSPISAAPNSPIWRLAARSSSAIASASSSSTPRQSLPAVFRAARMRASAQARFTAVGRAALRRCRAGSSLSAASAGVAAITSRAASTTPQAAAIPMAGAPRTARSWMAAATSSLVVQLRYSTTNGSLRWSSSSSALPVQRMGRMRS